MIKSIRRTATRQFIEQGKSKFSGIDEGMARRRLAALNHADTLDEFRQLQSFRLHKLKGDRDGFWSISINAGWRIVFRFEGGDAYEVEIVDCH